LFHTQGPIKDAANKAECFLPTTNLMLSASAKNEPDIDEIPLPPLRLLPPRKSSLYKLINQMIKGSQPKPKQ